jgi:pseudouridine-5'-phosphate glycosidase
MLAKVGKSAVKVSRRDIAAVVASGKPGPSILAYSTPPLTSATGATTVSATSVIAHMAGIKVFVTGGIGGVHRGVEQSEY